MKDEMLKNIAEILTDKLRGDSRRTIYCDTCNQNNISGEESRCEDCYRKNMGWGISNSYAEEIAKEIIKATHKYQPKGE